MTDVVIDLLNPEDHKLLAHLYNQVYHPERTPESIARRLHCRTNVLALAANIKNDALGFYIGFELKPSVHYAWVVGVRKDSQRMGIASMLMRRAQYWARDTGYTSIRFECNNTHRPMLHFGISEGYKIVGIRWDPDTADNVVIFEKLLDNLPNELQ